MEPAPEILTRLLKPVDVPEALALARAGGAQGVYLANVLESHPRLGSQAVFLGWERDERLIGMAHFGPRGNLLALEAEGSQQDSDAVAESVLTLGFAWRIALAPHGLARALVELGQIATIVFREQCYYSVDPQGLVVNGAGADLATDAVRLAEKKDLDALMFAALQLNQSDLMVDPWRVDRDWLKRTTRSRIRKRTTYVIGPVGQPRAKLDLGTVGTAGVVIEGVYTWPKYRGQGYASRLIAAVAQAHWDLTSRVCLHVAADNLPARRAYERCGMDLEATCHLILRR